MRGGGERDRTDDLLRARQALSQLSYTPIANPLNRKGVRGEISTIEHVKPWFLAPMPIICES